MNHLRIRTALMFALFGVSALALSGCNTVQGVGEDLEKAGEEVQEAAEETKN